MPERLGVELARVGTFDLQEGGRQTFTPGMLTSAAAKKGRAPLKLGHLAAALNDGAPAFGWLGNYRTQGEGDETVLLGDITDIPTWLDESADWAYPHRSIEGNVRSTGNGERDLEITGLALLGATPPGMPTISSWRDLPKALAAAAATTAPTDLTVTEFRAAFEALAPLADSPAAQTPAGPPDSNTPSTNPKEADGMSDTLIKGLRERFGFAEDADESAILAAVDGARDPDVTPDAIAAAYGIPADQVETRLKADTVVPDGKKLVDADQWADVVKLAAAGAEARKVQLEQDRDATIDQAFRDGKISAAAKPSWVKRWDEQGEDITRADLQSLEVVFPIAAAAGHGDTPTSTEDDATYQRLFGAQNGS